MIEDSSHAETPTLQKAHVPAEDQTSTLEEPASIPLVAEEVPANASTEQMTQQAHPNSPGPYSGCKAAAR